MRSCDVSDDGVQKFVVVFHLLAVLGFLVELEAQLWQRVVVSDSRRFKQIQHLFSVRAAVTDVAVFADIDCVIGVNGTRCLFLLVRRGVKLLEKEDNTGFRRIVFVSRDCVRPLRAWLLILPCFFRDTLAIGQRNNRT